MAQETWIVTEPTVIDLELVRALKVGLIGGQVDIVAHDEPGARVAVHSVAGRDLKVSLEGDTLVVDHPQLKWETFFDNFRLFSGKARADVSILVPRVTAVTLSVVAAEAMVSDLVFDLKGSRRHVAARRRSTPSTAMSCSTGSSATSRCTP